MFMRRLNPEILLSDGKQDQRATLVTKINTNTKAELIRHSHYRGIYSRVAEQLGLDRSYVSRVANGQRRSPTVEAALRKEIRRIESLLRK